MERDELVVFLDWRGDLDFLPVHALLAPDVAQASLPWLQRVAGSVAPHVRRRTMQQGFDRFPRKATPPVGFKYAATNFHF